MRMCVDFRCYLQMIKSFSFLRGCILFKFRVFESSGGSDLARVGSDRIELNLFLDRAWVGLGPLRSDTVP